VCRNGGHIEAADYQVTREAPAPLASRRLPIQVAAGFRCSASELLQHDRNACDRILSCRVCYTNSGSWRATQWMRECAAMADADLRLGLKERLDANMSEAECCPLSRPRDAKRCVSVATRTTAGHSSSPPPSIQMWEPPPLILHHGDARSPAPASLIRAACTGGARSGAPQAQGVWECPPGERV
jgi:hypothetical protein